MSHEYGALVLQFRETLTQQRYNRVIVDSYCRNADYFLSYLAERKIAFEAVTPTDVSNYLCLAVQRFCEGHSRAPARYWVSIPRAGIHGLLRLTLKHWPPEPATSDVGELLCREVCDQYQTWLREERGLAVASIDALMWEARYFCAWHMGRSATPTFMDLSIQDVDVYFDMRAPGLRRKSLKDVAERLRGLMRHLHRTGRTAVDLSPQIIAPMLYAYETIPSALSSVQIAAVLKSTLEDRSPLGLRDYAILLLLSTYGLRDKEIRRLRLDDIDWRAGTITLRRTKGRREDVLPLPATTGAAIAAYLQHERPKTRNHAIFVRHVAPRDQPVGPDLVRKTIKRAYARAGLPYTRSHLLRHTMANRLLAGGSSLKEVADVLRHRSLNTTLIYAKLDSRNLVEVALPWPGSAS